MDKTLGRHIKMALGYFLLAALLGVLLRFYPVADLPVNYRYMVHTHSHIALMGWVYLALTVILCHCFLKRDAGQKKYRILFWATQGTLLGMLFSFPFQGYALFSITFSTLFLFCSYLFFGFFVKHIRPGLQGTPALYCVRAAFWYMVLSSIGPWALGGIMATLGPGSIWYRLAIYFYLHFQYNGWMVLALVGLLVFLLEQRGRMLPPDGFRRFYWTMNLGIVLSFFLSALWTGPHWSLFVLGGAGALLQLYALGLLWQMVARGKGIPPLSSLQARMLRAATLFLGLKMAMQLLTALPYFARLAFSFLDFTIGYLHLTFLGVVSIGLFFFTDYWGLLRISKKAYTLYFLGFLITEALIFYRGTAAWLSLPVFGGFSQGLALGSLLIPLALLAPLVHKRPNKPLPPRD